MKTKISTAFLLGNYYSFIVTGLIVLMTGAILPYLMKDFGLSYDQGGLLLSLQAVGNLAAGVAGGIASDFIGRKLTLAFGALFFFLGFGGILICPSTLWLFIFIFLSGIGWGTLNNLVNAVVSDATDGRSSILNLLHTFFAIGAFTAPFLIGIFVRLGLGWRFPVALVAALSAVLVIVFLFMRIETPEAGKAAGKLSFEFLKDIRFFIFMGILFFYVGTESSLNGWLVTYLIDSGLMGESGAQGLLSAMWVVMIGGRLTCAYISSKLSKEIIILGSSIGGLVSMAIFLLSKNFFLIMACVFVLGMSLAGIYPTTIANASRLIKGSGAASGLMLSCSGLGASVVPFIVGLWAEGRGIHSGMLIIILSAGLLTALAAFNFTAGRRSEAEKT